MKNDSPLQIFMLYRHGHAACAVFMPNFWTLYKKGVVGFLDTLDKHGGPCTSSFLTLLLWYYELRFEEFFPSSASLLECKWLGRDYLSSLTFCTVPIGSSHEKKEKGCFSSSGVVSPPRSSKVTIGTMNNLCISSLLQNPLVAASISKIRFMGIQPLFDNVFA